MNAFLTEAMDFIIVLAVAVVVAGLIGTLYATGIRLWAQGVTAEGEVEHSSHLSARVGAVVCFAACVVIVLFALWLMIPVFH